MQKDEMLLLKSKKVYIPKWKSEIWTWIKSYRRPALFW